MAQSNSEVIEQQICILESAVSSFMEHDVRLIVNGLVKRVQQILVLLRRRADSQQQLETWARFQRRIDNVNGQLRSRDCSVAADGYDSQLAYDQWLRYTSSTIDGRDAMSSRNMCNRDVEGRMQDQLLLNEDGTAKVISGRTKRVEDGKGGRSE